MGSLFKFSPIVNKRINAFTIDLFLIFVIKEITINSFVKSLDLIFFRFPFKVQYFLSTEFSIFSNVTWMSIFFAYFTLFPFLSNGRTPGKYILGLRVYAKDHELNLYQCMGRSLFYLFSIFTLCLPFLPTIYKKNHLGWGDMMSKTKVDLEKRPYIVDHETSWQLSFFDYLGENHRDQAETKGLSLVSSKNSPTTLESSEKKYDNSEKDAA